MPLVDRAAPADGPLVIAHRGASRDAPEHSLEAFERAIADGADGLECDVRRTLDGHLVCVHDRRIERTSDGWGAVSSKTLRELHHHDFVTWAQGPRMTSREARVAKLKARARRPQALVESYALRAERDRRISPFPVRSADPELDANAERGKLLTLRTLLELAVSTPRPLLLAIETKHPTRYAGLVERDLIELLRYFGLHRSPRPDRTSVQIMSFSAQAVRRVRELAPVLPAVFLMERVPVRMRDGVLPFGARVAGPGIHILREHPGYVRRVHRAGGQVHVWTVDSPADIQLCQDLGVDAVITNTPALTRVLLERGRPD